MYQETLRNVGQVMVHAAHIAYKHRVFLVAGLATPSQYTQVDEALAQAIATFEPLSAAEAARIQPSRVDLYVVRAGDTWQALAEGPGRGAVSPQELAILNGSEVGAAPKAGVRIKLVTEG